MTKLIINAQIHDMEGNVYPNGWIAVDGAKIAALGGGSAPPEYSSCEKSEIYDARGAVVYPGFVEAHCHLGMFGDSLGFEGDDGNEATDPSTPQLRAIDAVNPMDRYFGEALSAGVTAILTGPGSANPIGGQFIAMKTYGSRVDDMIIKSPACIKMAFGENPKSCYKDKGPSSRMGTASVIRETLCRAREYLGKKDEIFEYNAKLEPDKYQKEKKDFAPDYKLESLVPLLRGEIPAHMHAHRADDIYTAIRIAKEFNLKFVIIHGTEGHLIADALAADNVAVISGPALSERSKPELRGLTFASPGIMSGAGVKIAITTDHPVIPLKYLPVCAALAVKEGLCFDAALRAITIDAAEICGISDRVGSLKPGKDADFVLFNGHPLDIFTKVLDVFINGVRVTPTDTINTKL